MEHLNTAQASSLYGVNMGEYADVGVSSMMALMTEHEPESESIMTTVPTSFSSFHTQGECLLSPAMFQAANSQANHGDKVMQRPSAAPGHFVMEQFLSDQAAGISDTSLPSVKTEVCSNLAGQFEFHREQAGCCYTESSLMLSPLVASLGSHPEETRMATFLEVASPRFCIKPNEADAMKTRIVAHPHFPSLMEAYMDCQKVGASPEVVARLDAFSQEYENRQRPATISIGLDPELDQFMESYCEMLIKYHEELTKPFKEAMSFLKKIEAQLNTLSKGTIRIFPSGENDEKGDAAGSSEEEDGSGGEMEFQDVDPHAEDRELKDHLLRKYSGYLSSLKQEFLKKKKKGKLPKDARQKLLDWWNLHYKWPYPSETEKLALAESTGLDQKQINNWFINQRKRHWKPSEDMQFVVMDSHNIHSAALYVESHLVTDGPAFHLDC